MWTKKYVTIVALITVAVLAIGGILWNRDTGSLTTMPASEWQRGTKDAAITIDMYPDFTCHICVEKEHLVLQAFDMYPENVRMVYHHYPFSEFGQKLAEALEAAGKQGKFWELHDRFIQDVPRNVSELKVCAEEIGLDMPKFEKALDIGKFSGKVELDKQRAVLHGVDHVSVYVNGKEYRHAPGTLSDLCAAIDEELTRIGANVSD